MKQRKRMISILLVLSMILSLLPVSAFAEGDRFTDVKPTNWFYNAVEYVCENGIMSGTGKTTFGPNETTTRGMIVTVLYNMEGKPAVSGNVFNDVEEKAYYKNAVTWASANGIVSGYGAGKFGPKDAITREQMAAILFNYAKFKGYDTSVTGTLSGFSDIGKISSYAVKAVTWAVEKGLISGMGDNRIEPKGTALRAQVAVILMQFNNKIANGGTVVPPKQDTNVKVDQNEGATPPANSNSGGVNHTVTFELIFSEFVSNKAAFSAQMVADGAAMTKPVDPVLPLGYFDGWYTDPTYEKVFDFNTKIKEDMVLYAKWAVDKTDSDKEGLYDDVEVYMGLNKNDPDTDGDGVDDYTELMAGTDPLKNDGSGDVDGDGLSNAEEAKLGTSLTGSDSDFDDLTDKEEVKTYKTDPLKEDTDGDSAEDGWEVLNGFDPLSANKTFEVKQSLGKVSKDNPVAASVTTSLKGEQADTLEMDIVTYADNPLISTGIPGYLGVAYDFTVEGEIDEATLEFKYDKSLGKIGDDFQPRIYYLNEEDGLLEELKNQTVKDGVVTAGVEHFSTYILLNKVEFDKVWETDIKPADEREQKKAMDVTFVIDYSYSMVSNDPDGLAKKLATEFVDKLRDKDEAAVIKFMQKPKVLKKLTDDKEALKKAIAEIEYDPSKGNESGVSGTNGSYGLKKAVELMLEEAYSPKKHIIFITDGEDTHYGENVNWMNQDRAPTAAQLKGQKKAYEEVIALAKEYGINIFTVRIGAASEDILKWIADSTGGKYFDATIDLEATLEDAEGELIDYYKDSNADGISDYHTELICSGEMTQSNGATPLKGFYDVLAVTDWDKDGLVNSEEIVIVTKYGKTYYEMIANPIWKDSDFDGQDDFEELQWGCDPLRLEYRAEYYNYLTENDNFLHSYYFRSGVEDIPSVKEEVKEEEGLAQILMALKKMGKKGLDHLADADMAKGIYIYAREELDEIYVNTIIEYIGQYGIEYQYMEQAEKRLQALDALDQIFVAFGDNLADASNNVASTAFFAENVYTLINAVNSVKELKNVEVAKIDVVYNYLGDTINSAYKATRGELKLKFTMKRLMPKSIDFASTDKLKLGSLNSPSIIAFVAVDVFNAKQETREILNNLAIVNANSELYNNYIEFLEYLKKHSVDTNIRDAANTVINAMNEELYNRICLDERLNEIGELSIDLAFTLATIEPHISAIKFIRDTADWIFEVKDSVVTHEKMYLYDRMASAASGLIWENTEAKSPDKTFWSYNNIKTAGYLHDLVHLRMLGEKEYKTFNTDGCANQIARRMMEILEEDSLDEMLKSRTDNIKFAADQLGVVLNPKVLDW